MSARVCAAAVRSGELPQQSFPQLPPLFLRHADDVRLRSSLRTVEQVVSRGHRHTADSLDLVLGLSTVLGQSTTLRISTIFGLRPLWIFWPSHDLLPSFHYFDSFDHLGLLSLSTDLNFLTVLGPSSLDHRSVVGCFDSSGSFDLPVTSTASPLFWVFRPSGPSPNSQSSWVSQPWRCLSKSWLLIFCISLWISFLSIFHSVTLFSPRYCWQPVSATILTTQDTTTRAYCIIHWLSSQDRMT